MKRPYPNQTLGHCNRDTVKIYEKLRNNLYFELYAAASKSFRNVIQIILEKFIYQYKITTDEKVQMDKDGLILIDLIKVINLKDYSTLTLDYQLYRSSSSILIDGQKWMYSKQ